MRVAAPPVSDLRLQRHQRWTLLWLTWLAAFLEGAAAFAPLSREARDIAHGWLDRIERLVVSIAILHAAARVRCLQQRRGPSPYRRNETAMRRAIVGVRLRRMLRPRDLRQRIAALRQSVHALAARILKRLPRGLTRRRPIRARREAHPVAITRAPVAPPPCANTS